MNVKNCLIILMIKFKSSRKYFRLRIVESLVAKLIKKNVLNDKIFELLV